MTEEQVQDVASVDHLRKCHKELKAEIDTSAETYTSVVKAGKEMVAQGHFAAEDIQDTDKLYDQ